MKVITAGYYHFGAITDDGKLYAWGDNNYGCLGFEKFNEDLIVNLIFPHAVDL